MPTINGVALFVNTMQSDLALLDVLLVSCAHMRVKCKC